ncbi:MAG TPA: Fic family protein [Candidatus Elarobacter sp.]|nr:Fic family protein [Candidatus Elarobacter sp.]
MISYLDVEDDLEIFEALIGSPQELLRSPELLESAVLTPQQSAFGEDAYATLGHKAWAYLRGLAQNHAFVDGNKRIAWATTRAFLLVNGIGISAPTPVVEDLVVRLAAGEANEAEVIAFFERYGYVLDDAPVPTQ